MLLLADHLAGRRRRDGANPLITYYDPAAAERTELSATSFANWVDKTANLIVDDWGLGAGDRLAAPLLTERPGHWISLVWAMATWQAGVALGVEPDDADAWVVGPGGLHRPERPLLACSLHPLGLGFTHRLPDGIEDFGTEVRGMPDSYLGAPASAAAPAWLAPDGTQLTQADLVAGAPGGHPGASARRRLVRPTDPWGTLSAALIEPILTGGSVVVVAGKLEPDRLAKISADERIG